jgi:hypothetical protein
MKKIIFAIAGTVTLLMSISGSAGAQGYGHPPDRVKGHEVQHGNNGNNGKHGDWQGKHKGTWNPAPPKKNGRHDNRNWNKSHKDEWAGVHHENGRVYSSPAYTYNRRQQTKNEWRNLATVGGLVSVLGLLTHDKTLVFAGAAGGLYSLYRYEEDRKSQSKLNRARAYYFTQPYFVRDGQRYNRRLVVQGGQRYYQFVRA